MYITHYEVYLSLRLLGCYQYEIWVEAGENVRQMTNPRTTFDDSTDILGDAAKKLRITDAVNPQSS